MVRVSKKCMLASLLVVAHFFTSLFASELFGIFLVENGMAERGMEQFKLAHAKYIQWGALKKAEKLMEFMGIVSPSSLRGIGIRI